MSCTLLLAACDDAEEWTEDAVHSQYSVKKRKKGCTAALKRTEDAGVEQCSGKKRLKGCAAAAVRTGGGQAGASKGVGLQGARALLCHAAAFDARQSQALRTQERRTKPSLILP